MTTEQMDWLDDERAGRHDDTASRRKREAAQGPVILFGKPSIEELAEARGRAGSRGILVLPEALRDSAIANGGWKEPDSNIVGVENGRIVRERTTSESFTDANVCTDPRCPWPGRHVRKDENTLSECPLVAADGGRDWPEVPTEPEPTETDDVATMAEEPIETRLRRAFLNGFREGVDRGANIVEGWGRWDA